MRRIGIALAAALIGWLAPQPAWSFTCSVSATPMAFGAYSGSSAITTTATVTFGCIGLLGIAVIYNITLDGGGSGSISARSMAGPSAPRLAYQIYTNAGHTTVWGDGTGGTSTQAGLFLLSALNPSASYTAYGIILAGLNVPGGSYTDGVLITVTY